MKNKILLVLVLLFSVFILFNCAKKLKKQSELDTPQYHTKLGLDLLNKGNLQGAQEEFDRAIGLDPDFSRAYAGLCLLYTEKKDFEKADDNCDKALDKAENDDNKAFALVAKGRMLTAKDPKEEFEDALDAFNEALDKKKDYPAALFYRGKLYKVHYDFKKAETDFSKLVEMKREFTEEANAEWKLVQKIVRAMPGTDVGNIIALIDEITRGDVAALFITELKLPKLLEKKRPKKQDMSFPGTGGSDEKAFQTETTTKAPEVTDLEGSWVKNYVDEILRVGVRGLEAFPDHTFKPNEKITRSNFAIMIEDILITITGENDLATKFIGQQSTFNDVRSDNFAYNAIMTCTSRGILQANMDGTFEPGKPVSGADALLAIRKLENQLRL